MEQNQICISIKIRNFKCPCGKSYLSNAALFTHVKQKHQGKAPGQLKKPQYFYEKRGRPSYSIRKKKFIMLEKTFSKTHESLSQIQESSQQKKSYQIFQRLFEFLEDIPTEQKVDNEAWKNIQAFSLLGKFILQQYQQFKHSPFQYYGVCIGVGITQFLRSLIRLKYYQFQQVLLLLSAIVQYLMDENNRRDMLSEGPISQVVYSANQFLQNELDSLIEDINGGNLWVLQRNNAVKVLYCFLKWLHYKDYVYNNISLDAQASNLFDQQ